MKKSYRTYARTLARLSLACAGMAALPAGITADETLLCTEYITATSAVPYVITSPGHYCLVDNLATDGTPGAAIAIRSDSVYLDLNNYALDGSAGGSATVTSGIDSVADHDVTIRNGIVRGFMFGVDGRAGSTARNLIVEGIRAERNTVAGISVSNFPSSSNAGNMVRRNVVSDTGGSTYPGAGSSFGIIVNGGGHVVDNDVVNTFGRAPSSGQPGFAIDLRDGTAIASGNRISGADFGIECRSPGKYLRDNVAVATIPYGSQCTKVGVTNYP